MERNSATNSWGSHLIITAGVVLTVVMALLLAQMDTLPLHLPPASTAVAAVPTPAIIPSPHPATPLPTPTATPAPPTETAVPATGSKPTATAVPVLRPTCGIIPDGWIRYVVQPGDTYFYLSAQSGATINQIVEANCLDPNFLSSGIAIYLPSTPPIRVDCGPPIFWVRYTVQPGDTMYSLALRYGTTVYAIMQANCLDSPRLLVAGRQIYLPPLPASPTPLPTPTSPPTPRPQPTSPPATAVPTFTPLPSPTATPPATPTATTQPPTATSTPIVSTATPTPSFTPTSAATAVPTNTPSSTPTQTPAATATATATSAPTATPTFTPIPTNTATPIPTATSTPVPTDTPTP